jgi:hypothetical protein
MLIKASTFNSCHTGIVRSLSMVTTAVLSTKVAVVDPGEVDRSAVYSRYNSGPKTLPWSTPALTDDSSEYSVSTFTRKCLLCREDFRIMK